MGKRDKAEGKITFQALKPKKVHPFAPWKQHFSQDNIS
jgi:hypothetical protein